jgi:hypothetical protein
MKNLQLVKLLLIVFVALPLFATAAQSQSAPAATDQQPELKLALKPHTTNGAVDYIDVILTIGRPQVKQGGTLLRMALLIVSIPTPRYDGDAIKAHDTAGDLPLTQKDEPPTPSGIYRQWLASRDTSGDVVVNFQAPMRAVSASTRPGPLFDLRAESSGLNGAGIAFLPLPHTEISYRIGVHWNLTGMPQGSRGVSSYGEGDIRITGKAEMLSDAYYAAGPLKSFPSEVSGNYAMYWLGEPSFDAQLVAENIYKFYSFVSKFFHDEGSSYRVFVRKNPYHGGGGTTLTRSFMFGYSDDKVPKPDELQGLLAHEIVHNWPAMEGEHGDTAWYSEGTAEYYSILLSHRASIYDLAKFQKEINQRASAYYTNPFVSLTNEQAAQKFWSDSRAQRIPYGRGFMYLARVDAEVRAKSGGKRSLDDLVLVMLDRKRHGEKYGVPEWLELVTKELGPEAKQEFEAMTRGELEVPAPNSFAPCLNPEKSDERSLEYGMDPKSLEGSDRKVQGLVPGSAAAQAGLQEGDIILESNRLAEVQDDPTVQLQLKVHRGDDVLTISYLPRGNVVPGYHWIRVVGVPETACGL